MHTYIQTYTHNVYMYVGGKKGENLGTRKRISIHTYIYMYVY